VETAELVVSLRTFIRDVLDLDPVPLSSSSEAGPLQSATGSSRRGGRSEEWQRMNAAAPAVVAARVGMLRNGPVWGWPEADTDGGSSS